VQIQIKAARLSTRAPEGGVAGNPNSCSDGKIQRGSPLLFASILILAFDSWRSLPENRRLI
jgi:hypothetical protein